MGIRSAKVKMKELTECKVSEVKTDDLAGHEVGESKDKRKGYEFSEINGGLRNDKEFSLNGLISCHYCITNKSHL